MNFTTWFRRYGLLVCCISLVPLLSGCLLLPLAAVGFGGVKMVQAFSKSSYEVYLDTPTIEDPNALASVNAIALWPEVKGQASSFYMGHALVSDADLAEQLSKSSSIEVISPFTVSHVLQTNALSSSLSDMMTKEKLQAFKVVSEQTGADAVLCAQPADMKDDSRFFSFKRSSETFTAQVQIYSKSKNAFVWEDMVVVVWKKGSTLPSDTEIQKAVAEKLADRLLEISGKKSVANIGTTTSVERTAS